MELKTFYVVGFVVVIVASILSSLVTVSLFNNKEPVLLGPEQQGLVEIGGGGLPTGIINVIIVDNNFFAGIEDTVSFINVVKENVYTTDLVNTSDAPYPFILENIGQEIADVEVYAMLPLFDYKYNTGDPLESSLKFQITEPNLAAESLANPFYQNLLDNCPVDTGDTALGKCFISAPDNPPIGQGFSYIPTGEGSKVKAIDDFYPFLDHNTAIMDIQITVSKFESPGTKATTVVIIGVPA